MRPMDEEATEHGGLFLGSYLQRGRIGGPMLLISWAV